MGLAVASLAWQCSLLLEKRDVQVPAGLQYLHMVLNAVMISNITELAVRLSAQQAGAAQAGSWIQVVMNLMLAVSSAEAKVSPGQCIFPGCTQHRPVRWLRL